MRRLRTELVSLACLGLLGVQLSGLHMHLDAHGYSGVPVGTHVHHAGDHHHDHAAAIHEHGAEEQHDRQRGDADHDGDQDVSVVQLAGAAGKIVLFFVWTVLGFIVVRDVGSRISVPLLPFVPKRHPLRWRPPLRGPPAFSR
jgi:hypothetical protein